MLPPPWLKIMQRYFFPAKYYINSQDTYLSAFLMTGSTLST